MTLIIERNQDADFAFASIAIILCCFVSFGLIFLPKILCVIRGRDQPFSSNDSKTHSRSNSAGGNSGNPAMQQLSSEDEEKHKKLVTENEQLKALIAEREARVNELIEKLKQRGSNIVIRDVQRFSISAGAGHRSSVHDGDQAGTLDAAAYVMRRRSTFVNPITLSTRLSNAFLTTTATASIAQKSAEVQSKSNNMKKPTGASYRESVC